MYYFIIFIKVETENARMEVCGLAIYHVQSNKVVYERAMLNPNRTSGCNFNALSRPLLGDQAVKSHTTRVPPPCPCRMGGGLIYDFR
jgi:hypothetical protein